VAQPLRPHFGALILLLASLATLIAVLTGSVAAGAPSLPAAILLIVIASVVWLLAHPALLSWTNLLSGVIVVILAIPIRRFELPGNLPFQLEPYRVMIAFVALGWIASLLVDRRLRVARTPLNLPIAAVVVVCAASIAFNVGRIEDLRVSQDALKQFTFLLSFALVFLLTVSVVRTFDQIDLLLRILVAGGAIVAALALVELWAGVNPFNHIDRVLPFLEPTGPRAEGGLERAGRLRVYASAQHPIGLGELLVLLIPMGIYVAISSKRRIWFGAVFLLGLAAFATVSRTAVVSLAAIGVVYVALRPSATLRFWPLLLPGLIAVHIAMPGTLGSIYKGLFPKQGLIAHEAGAAVGSSRTASFGPGVHEVSLRPLLGGGYGSRIPTGPDANSFIVDNQWLSTAMETGLAGVAAWLWVFARFLRQMFKAARWEHGERGWLFVGTAAAAAGFAIGMATYDSFSFIQAMLVLFFLLALGCAGLAARAREEALGATRAA
jgi:hypothetical protein